MNNLKRSIRPGLILTALILITAACQSNGSPDSSPAPASTQTPTATRALPPTWTPVPAVFVPPSPYRTPWPTPRRDSVPVASTATRTPSAAPDVLTSAGLETVAWAKHIKGYEDIDSPFQSSDLWDLMTCDLTLSFTLELSGRFDAPLVGIMGGASGWMSAQTLSNQDRLVDQLVLATFLGDDESTYDVLHSGAIERSPFGHMWQGYGLRFERGEPTSTDRWGMVDGATYNTGGIYRVVITYHAIDQNNGTMFATVNGVQAGCYECQDSGQPDYYPVGKSFSGDDLTAVRVFASPNGALIKGLTVQACPSVFYVAVDIRPDCITSGIDTIQAIIFGDSSVDVSEINPLTIRIGTQGVKIVNGIVMAHAEYLNDDPYPDLNVQLWNGLEGDQPFTVLTGQLKNYRQFEGTDTLCTTP